MLEKSGIVDMKLLLLDFSSTDVYRAEEGWIAIGAEFQRHVFDGRVENSVRIPAPALHHQIFHHFPAPRVDINGNSSGKQTFIRIKKRKFNNFHH